jgi:hypothetical protein
MMKTTLTTIMAAASLVVLRPVPGRWADGANLLVCQDRGFVVNQCALATGKLAEPVTDIDGLVTETEYAVQYDFPCAGNPLHVGVQSGASHQEFRQGALGGTLTGIVGSAPLGTFDPDPVTTRQRSMRPGCHLAVTKVTAFPSNGAIHLWGVQAADEARILSSSLTLYELGKDYASLASWNTSKLALLHDRLVVLLESDPDNLSFKTMLETVDAAMHDAPLPVTAEEFHAAGQTVIQALRASLDAEVARGTKMMAQFDQWHLAVERTLKDVLGTIPA